MTPEGKVKAAVKRLIAKYSRVYSIWPVPYGFGQSSLDCLICVNGLFVAVETKAPGNKLTPRQELCKRNIELAGGVVFVIEDDEGLAKLEEFLEKCYPFK